MMKKIANHTVSIVNRLTLFMLFLGIIALSALSTSAGIANDTQGSAGTINQLGLLRMKSYQLLSMVPLSTNQYRYLELFKPNDEDQQQLLERYELWDDFLAIQAQWNNSLADTIKSAQHIADIKHDIADFVAKIDHLVYKIDQKTERQITIITQIQFAFIGIILLCLLAQIYYLRRHLLKPWQQLITLANAISKHDFSYRFQQKRNDEFGVLGQAFNCMADEIHSHYTQLEQRVHEKTIELQHKNATVTFLYNAIKQLNTQQPVCERFLSILHKLEALTPLTHFQIRFYESDDHSQYHLFGYAQKQQQSYCQNKYCSACVIPSEKTGGNVHHRHWYLQDHDKKYGMVIATQPNKQHLTPEQEKLVSTLIEQMTRTLILERQVEYQKQFLLMQERSAIARELHDSIAQSLSCLKMQLSCLQRKNNIGDDENQQLLNDMRREVNVAYSQLRELLTTFRLQIDNTGFLANLKNLLAEFNQKLGFDIEFIYQLSLQAITSHQTIHLLQIIREALNNIYKHAQATHVTVKLSHQAENIELTIQDNGIGLPNSWHKDDHYGLIIMQDRTELLQGDFSINSQPNNGTTIMITFLEQSNKSWRLINKPLMLAKLN